MSHSLSIHLFFDYVCPWCYLTEMALEQLSDRYPLNLIFRAFPLWPEGLSQLSPEEREALRLRIHAADRRAIHAARAWFGVEGMKLGPWGVSTLDAHVGAKFAARYGRLREYQQVLFNAQFHRELRLDSRQTLILLASEAGLPVEDFLSALDVEKYRNAVLADQAQALQLGITGVPAMVIEQRYLLTGAQSPERLASILEYVLSEQGATS